MTFRVFSLLVGIALGLAVLPAQSPRPDQVLYDSAISDIQHKRYDRARLELQTLVNTYTSSELLGPAKAAICDSWYREGGARGHAQAESECKDVILLFPDSPAASDAQKILQKMADARAKKK